MKNDTNETLIDEFMEDLAAVRERVFELEFSSDDCLKESILLIVPETRHLESLVETIRSNIEVPRAVGMIDQVVSGQSPDSVLEGFLSREE